MYWQQWSLRRKFRHAHLNEEWVTYSWYYKVYLYCEYPWVLARDLTIPTLDDSGWNKFYAVAHPLADSLFITFLFDIFGDSFSTIGKVVTCVAISALPSIFIYLSTSNSKSPADPYFIAVWSFLAFAMCICWVYMLAGE